MNVRTLRLALLLSTMLVLSACAQKQSAVADITSSAAEDAQTALPESVSASARSSAPDADNDGVTDAQDSCAETPPLRPVDQSGCELFDGKLDAVEFAPDSFELSAESELALDQLITHMNAHPDVVLAISGHTDNRGNARENLELSKKRVLAVVRYLVLNGINGRRLHPHGYGESRPLYSNATEEGRKRNRRIEISLIPAQ